MHVVCRVDACLTHDLIPATGLDRSLLRGLSAAFTPTGVGAGAGPDHRPRVTRRCSEFPSLVTLVRDAGGTPGSSKIGSSPSSRPCRPVTRAWRYGTIPASRITSLRCRSLRELPLEFTSTFATINRNTLTTGAFPTGKRRDLRSLRLRPPSYCSCFQGEPDEKRQRHDYPPAPRLLYSSIYPLKAGALHP